MARAKKITELTALTTATSPDILLIVDDPAGAAETKKITVADFFANVSCNVVFNSTTVLPSTTTPTGPTSTGRKGEIRYDSDYIYICVATNTWKRTAISTW
jgi:hypothetical protein